ncbi:MAG: GNAT family N-acetyltransferase [Clostridia bacterium]|nr:GNAT family N-acetyltransferase [Clostridia bacterium]
MNNSNGIGIFGYKKLPQDAVDIRIKVFVEEQGFDEEFDSDDERSMHFVAYLNDNAVGTCRLIRLDPERHIYAIGRVAVLKDYRCRGIASELIASAEQYLSANDTEGATVLIHSQLTAVGFYEKLGYKLTGERDVEQGCPHAMLKKDI